MSAATTHARSVPARMPAAAWWPTMQLLTINVEEVHVSTKRTATPIQAGDRLVVRAHRQGDTPRDAEILEVLGENGAPYRVRWESDGHESIIYPGSDATIEHFPRRRKR